MSLYSEHIMTRELLADSGCTTDAEIEQALAILSEVYGCPVRLWEPEADTPLVVEKPS